MIKSLKKAGCVALLLLLASPQSTNAITSWKISDATTIAEPNSEISNHTLAVNLDLDRTKWIAWNDASSLVTPHPDQPGEMMLGASLGVNDFIRLTVTNPSGLSLSLDIDQNDGSATSFGPQAVIFGQAETAPDVYRFSDITGQSRIFDEAGSHNDIFTESGEYTFQFSMQNVFGSGGQNGTWLLADIAPPEPPPISVFDRDLAGWQAAVTATQLPAQYLTTINFDDVPSDVHSLPSDFYRGFFGSPTIGAIQGDLLKGRKVQIHQGIGEEIPQSPPNAMGVNARYGTTVRVEFDEPVRAIGAYFLDLEPRGLETTGFDTDADGVPDVKFSSAPGDYSKAFLGFTSEKPLRFVDIHLATGCEPIDDAICGDGVSIDDLQYLTQPNTLALHEGSLNPVSQGWVAERGFVNVDRFPLTDDNGYHAWAIDDNGYRTGDGLYTRALSEADVERAMQVGWTLSGNLRAVDFEAFGTAFVGVSLDAPVGKWFGFDPIIDDPPTKYHYYELDYDPASQSATLYIDGVIKSTGITGSDLPQDPDKTRNAVWFGSSASDGMGQGNYNLVRFRINSPVAQGLPVGNLLQNAGFDHSEESTAPTTHFRDWGGDAARFVREESGITAAGTEMLQFLSANGADTNDTTSDLTQYVDVSAYRDQIRTGYVRAELSADFNRVGTDTGFAVTLSAHNGTPASSPTHATAIDGEMTPIETDGDAATWQTATVTLAVPFNAEFLQATLSAVKNATGELPGTEFGGHFADNASLILYLVGDINNDGDWGVDDLDLLSQAIRTGTTTRRMDINGNGTVTPEDRRVWVEVLANTYFGDANFDGQFDSADLVSVFQAGEYEDGIAGNSTWADGDFSGDSEFDSADLIVAFQFGVYDGGPRSASAVPEPSCVVLLALGCVALVGLRRTSSNRSSV